MISTRVTTDEKVVAGVATGGYVSFFCHSCEIASHCCRGGNRPGAGFEEGGSREFHICCTDVKSALCRYPKFGGYFSVTNAWPPWISVLVQLQP